MNLQQRADIWDEVWAEYDARQAQRAEAPPSPAPRPPAWSDAGPARPCPAPLASGLAGAAFSPLVQVGAGVLAGALLLLGWFALPWLLAARLSAPMEQGDAPGLMRQFDGPAAIGSLRDALRAEVADQTGAGARRFLTGMADRMAESWERPEAVAAWLAVRRGGRGEGSPVALPLRSVRAVGLASFRLEYGPARDEAGVAFDMAWRGDGFRVTGLRFLQPPAAPPGGIAVAMR